MSSFKSCCFAERRYVDGSILTKCQFVYGKKTSAVKLSQTGCRYQLERIKRFDRPGIGERSIVMIVSVCLCVSVCLSVRKHISGNTRPIFTKFTARVTHGRGSVLFWRRCDTLCTSGLMNDVIFPHKPKQLNVAAQLMEAQPTRGLRLDCKRRVRIPVAGQCTHTQRPIPRA